MGNWCCCRKRGDDQDGLIEIELNKMNEAGLKNIESMTNWQYSIKNSTSFKIKIFLVSCKCGATSESIKCSRPEGKGYHVEGTGIALGSCSLECDTAYFEVRIGSKNPQNVRVGVKRYNPKRPSSLSGQLDEDTDPTSPNWALKCPLKEGDVVGVFWDQTDLPMLSFQLNGKDLQDASIVRVRPSHDIYPAISLKDAQCELLFQDSEFVHPPKQSKFKMIVCATNLI